MGIAMSAAHSQEERIELLKKALEIAGSKYAFMREVICSIAEHPGTMYVTRMIEGRKQISDYTLSLIKDYLQRKRASKR